MTWWWWFQSLWFSMVTLCLSMEDLVNVSNLYFSVGMLNTENILLWNAKNHRNVQHVIIFSILFMAIHWTTPGHQHGFRISRVVSAIISMSWPRWQLGPGFFTYIVQDVDVISLETLYVVPVRWCLNLNDILDTMTQYLAYLGVPKLFLRIYIGTFRNSDALLWFVVVLLASSIYRGFPEVPCFNVQLNPPRKASKGVITQPI